MSINELRGKIEQLEEALNLPGSEDAKASIRMGIDAAKKKLKQMEDEDDGGKDEEKDKDKEKDKKNRNKREPRSRTKKGKKGKKGNISVDCDELLKRYKKGQRKQKERARERKDKGMPSEKTFGEKIKSLSKKVAKTAVKEDKKDKKFTKQEEDSIKKSIVKTIETFMESNESGKRKEEFLNDISKKIESFRRKKYEDGGLLSDEDKKFRTGDSIINNKTGERFRIEGYKPSYVKDDFIVTLVNVENGKKCRYIFPAQENLFKHLER